MRRVFVALIFFSVPAGAQSANELNTEVAELRALVMKLQARVDRLEARAQPAAVAPLASAAVAPPQAAVGGGTPEPSTALPGGTTFNFLIDGYYGYNFNSPIGRANLLRAYDVTSNAFSLNQATVVIENAPDPARGKRYGARLDLQFGQATATLQGSAANEPRPAIYRNIFQAYGTYVFPVGSGLTVDFGKWSSAMGIENNYTKDQINYSRSYWFNFLPFYHMGARAAYKPKDWLTLNYWIINGTGWTEPFNGYKDQLVGVTAQSKKLSWTLNYYRGQEHPDFEFVTTPGPGDANLPTLQGTPFRPITPAANGKLHILDSYLSWQATPKLLFAIEGDYVIQRLESNSPPAHTSGGAVYARYQVSPRFAIAGRAEYLSDRGGLFSGTTQALKETTFTLEHKLTDGFLVREEWRRDFSNHAYFLTDQLGVLKKEQNTATIGLVWWFGRKQGPW